MEHAGEFKRIADNMAALKEKRASLLERLNNDSAANYRIRRIFLCLEICNFYSTISKFCNI